MSRNALLGRAVAAITALFVTAGAVADMVPLDVDPLNPHADAIAADQWTAGTAEPDPLAELLSAMPPVSEARAPLLELMGMPPPPVRRGRAAGFTIPGLIEQTSAASSPDTGRLANPVAFEEADDGANTLRREALGILEGLNGSADPSEPSGAQRQMFAPAEPLPSHATAGPAEVRSSWLREGLLVLRANREWVLVAMLFALGAALGIWHFGQSTGAPKPRARTPARLAQ